MRDVLYACQGISGKFTVYEESGSVVGANFSSAVDAAGKGGAQQQQQQQPAGFRVVREAAVPEAERTLVARLTEVGWLFRCAVCQGI